MGDITYIATAEGWLYLKVVIDLFNREVIGWSIQPRMMTDLELNALTIMPHAMAASKLALLPFRVRRKTGGIGTRAHAPSPRPDENYSACGSDFRSALFRSIACSRLKTLTAHSQARPHPAASPAFSQKNPLSSVDSAATMTRGMGCATQDRTA